MATTFFLRDAASDLGGAGQKLLSKTRGASAVSKVTNSTASGTNIQVTDTAGGQALTWFTPPLNSVTVSSTVTVNLRGLESSAADNAGGGVLVQRADGTGSVISDIVADTTVPAVITEYSSVAESAKNGTYTPTSTTLSSGDRIKVTLKLRNVGTMGAGTVQNFIDGPTAAASGDCFVTFTEAIGVQVSAAAAQPVTATATAAAATAKSVSGTRPVTATATAAATTAKSVTAAASITATIAAVAASAKPVSGNRPVTATATAAAMSAKQVTATRPVVATATAAAASAKPVSGTRATTASAAAALTATRSAAAALLVTAVITASMSVTIPHLPGTVTGSDGALMAAGAADWPLSGAGQASRALMTTGASDSSP